MNRATALPIFAGLASLTLTACQTPQQLAEHDALLIEPDAAARAEVRAAASTLLGGTPVLLAPDAFTLDSRLTLERMPRRSLLDLPLADRARFEPHRLRLVVSGGSCLLRNENSDTAVLLESAHCRVQINKPDER